MKIPTIIFGILSLLTLVVVMIIIISGKQTVVSNKEIIQLCDYSVSPPTCTLMDTKVRKSNAECIYTFVKRGSQVTAFFSEVNLNILYPEGDPKSQFGIRYCNIPDGMVPQFDINMPVYAVMYTPKYSSGPVAFIKVNAGEKTVSVFRYGNPTGYFVATDTANIFGTSLSWNV